MTGPLARDLADHAPADEAEAASLKRVRNYVEDAEAPMDREDTFGHVVASGLVASPALDRVVLLHHRQLDMWLQPGGHAEPGETRPSQVARREAREETGLDLEPHPDRPGLVDVDAHRIPATDRMPRHWHFDLRYVFQADPGEEPVVPDAEGHEVRWFTVDEAMAELELDEGLQRLIGKVAEGSRSSRS
jgi:8-oxo-dGTP pyrophosphatase MutT (NUDIX family)